MKKALWFIPFAMMIFLPWAANAQEAAPQVLEPGVEATGTLDAENFAQAYVFSGSTGDAITLDAFTESEGLSLILLLTSPSGVFVAQDADISDPDALIADFTLPEDGQYNVTILRGEGASGESTGDYTLTLSGELTEPVVVVGSTPAPTVAATGNDTATTTANLNTDGTTIVLGDGGIQIELGWAAAVNLDIEVRDPVGGTTFSGNLTSASGGTLAADVNADCAAATAETPTETVTWAGGSTVPTGSYEIILYYTNACNVGGPQQFTLTTQVNDDEASTIAGTLNPNQRYLAALEVEADGTWSLFNGGVNTGLDISLLSNQIAAATPFVGIQMNGAINRQTPAIAYTLEGVQGDTITLNLNAVSGSLDPFLILLDSNGAELASNDDAAAGNTNSSITYVVPQNGVYTAIATRYGQASGGTEGDFNLILSLTVATAGNTSVAPTPAPIGNDTTAIGTDTTVTGTDTTTGANTTTNTTVIRPEGLPIGSVEVILTWATTADVQLLVRDPAGAAVYDDDTEIDSGGILERDGNANCDGETAPTSYVYWPSSRLPRGVYEVEIWFQRNCEDTSPVTFNLAVNVQNEQIINTTQPISLDDRYAITFEISPEGAATAYDGGFFDMADVSSINYFALLNTAEVIEYGDTVPGNITAQERYKIYSFEAEVGDTVTVAMQRTGGTLDTALFLISTQGVQLAANDDIPQQATDGPRDTNSRIDSYEIPADGTYYVIATHYGLQYGGTTGSYNLTLVQLPAQ